MNKITEPVMSVKMVKMDKVKPNSYNPNFVAHKELELLYISIKEDGFTQPVVVYFDEDIKKYIIIDGFHRYRVVKKYKDIYDRMNGCIPVVVLTKSKQERIASTIRHNRARGRHEIVGMAYIVSQMVSEGMKDEEIVEALGMEKQELARLKIGSGWLKLFKNVNYTKAWKTKLQIELEQRYAKDNA